MPSAEARIATDRAERYLDQLCGHLGQMQHMQHMRHLPKSGHSGAGVPQVEHVEKAAGRGEIRFADGSWTLLADADSLLLQVEADDPAALERLKVAVTARIAKIGRRDGLTVRWHETTGQETSDTSNGDTGQGNGGNSCGSDGDPSRRRWWRRAGWSALIVLVAAIHLGLIGSLLGGGRWKDAAADAILGLLAIKLVLIAIHAKLGRGRSGATHSPQISHRRPWSSRSL